MSADPAPRKAHQFDFLAGGGEMGAHIRAFPWDSTALGPPDQWPSGLRTSLRILLTTQHPVFIFWGEQLCCFYNDAYSRSLGPEKHPFILGIPGRDAWPEIWHIIGPQIDQVIRGDTATWHENALVPIVRHGSLQDVYWTYSYSSVLDDEGNHAGILVTCTETTGKVETLNKLKYSEQRFQNLVRDATTAIVVLTGPEMKVEIVNQSYSSLIGRTPEELLGKPLFSVIPETEEYYLPLL